MGKQTAPNILMICTDQQRWDSLGCYGSGWAQTPVLDQLAKEGALFEQCYVQSPVCSPSRASLFTGKYLRNHGLWMNGASLPDEEILFTKVLADNGYDCGMIGKQHLSACEGGRTEPRHDDGYRVFEWSHDPIHSSPDNAYLNWLRTKHPQIYDDVIDKQSNTSEGGNNAKSSTPIDTVPVEAHYSQWVADRAIAFVQDDHRETDQPFFLIANFFDPHHPFGAPEAFRSRIDAGQIPPPISRPGELDEKPSVQQDYSRKSYGGFAPGYLDYSAEELQEIRAAYAAMVAMLDYQIGRILNALDEAGLRENTLVVFTSDHGEMLGDHQIMLKGPMMYDAITRVPLILRWPKNIPQGIRLNEPVQWIDLSATFLDVVSAQGEHKGQGESLLDLARGKETRWRNWAVSEYRENAQNGNPAVSTTMLRFDRYKLIIWLVEQEDNNLIEGELYDLKTDPHELYNLYHDTKYASTRESLKDELISLLSTTEDRSQKRIANW